MSNFLNVIVILGIMGIKEEANMKKAVKISALALALVFILGFAAQAEWAYKVKAKHAGGDVTPTVALRMVLKDKAHTFIVDVRTRPEYYFVGHPTVARHIPSRFWTGAIVGKKGKKEYELKNNPNFAKDLLGRFNPKTDTLIFMCRSGKRSCYGAEKAIKAGFKPERVFNMLGGFEGDKIKCKLSAFNGQRKLGGWKNEGLPWTYSINPRLAYKPNLGK